MATPVPHKEDIEQALFKILQDKAAGILQDVIDSATKDLVEQLQTLADTAALQVLSYYEVRDNGTHIVIRVEKKLGQEQDGSHTRG